MNAIRGVLAVLAGSALASCSGDASPTLERGPEDHEEIRLLPTPTRLGASVDWGDVGSIDVRASDGAVAVYDRQAGSIFVLQDGSQPTSFARRRIGSIAG